MPKLVKHGGTFRVTIPTKIVRLLGLKPGVNLSVTPRGREIIVRVSKAQSDELAAFPTSALIDEIRRRGAA